MNPKVPMQMNGSNKNDEAQLSVYSEKSLEPERIAMKKTNIQARTPATILGFLF